MQISDGDSNFLKLNADGSAKVSVVGSLTNPTGAIPFSVTATSSANVAGVATVAAVDGKQHYILGYLVALRSASASADILVTLKDNTTVKLTDVIGNASPTGTSAEKVSSMPIVIGTVNTAMNLGASAGGTGAITELTVWGYTL